MMMSLAEYPRHTPYASSGGTFRIGLQALDEKNWIEIDDRLNFYLDEKKRLYAEIPDAVFMADAGTEAVQKEVLENLVAHLLNTHGEIYRREEETIHIGDTGHFVRVRGDQLPPLLSAAFLVQEDLVIMRKGGDAWRLVAASVSFPSSWSLSEKFLRPLHEIHEPVPGFAEGTRNAMMIERIFDNLQPGEPVERFNWSVYGDDELYHSARSGDYVQRSLDSPDMQPHLRVERQTLHKLPKSGDILFTIRIHVDPLEMLANHPYCDRVSPAFEQALLRLDEKQLAYKGLAKDRDRLIEKIRELLPTAHEPLT